MLSDVWSSLGGEHCTVGQWLQQLR